jgi:hypothetical protein
MLFSFLFSKKDISILPELAMAKSPLESNFFAKPGFSSLNLPL